MSGLALAGTGGRTTGSRRLVQTQQSRRREAYGRVKSSDTPRRRGGSAAVCCCFLCVRCVIGDGDNGRAIGMPASATRVMAKGFFNTST